MRPIIQTTSMTRLIHDWLFLLLIYLHILDSTHFLVCTCNRNGCKPDIVPSHNRQVPIGTYMLCSDQWTTFRFRCRSFSRDDIVWNLHGRKRKTYFSFVLRLLPSVSPTLNASKLITALSWLVRIARSIDLDDRISFTDRLRAGGAKALTWRFTTSGRKILRRAPESSLILHKSTIRWTDGRINGLSFTSNIGTIDQIVG